MYALYPQSDLSRKRIDENMCVPLFRSGYAVLIFKENRHGSVYDQPIKAGPFKFFPISFFVRV